MMRIAALLIAVSLLSLSCGTAYRYRYCDYDSPTIDEKNKMRGREVDRHFRGDSGVYHPGSYR
jgi:hypothetical protein